MIPAGTYFSEVCEASTESMIQGKNAQCILYSIQSNQMQHSHDAASVVKRDQRYQYIFHVFVFVGEANVQ